MLCLFPRLAKFLASLANPNKTRKPGRDPLRLENLEERCCPSVTEFSLGTGHAPFQVASAPNDYVYVSETIANKVGVVNASGDLVAEVSIPTANASPLGIVYAADGGIWGTEVL